MPGIKRSAIWTASVVLQGLEDEGLTEFFRGFFAESVVSYTDLQRRRTVLTIYLKDRQTWTAQLPELNLAWSRCMSIEFPTFRVAKVRQEDWAESWKRHFHPMRIGHVWIRPSWSRVRLRRDDVEVVLDPGLSFGTGQHPTTGFCLREIVRRRKPDQPQSFLDIGTGSGILAIVAAKIGYCPVEAFDHDAEAVRIAAANARKNGVGRKVRFGVRDITGQPQANKTRAKYSVVCANLIANLIVETRDRILEQVEPGGVLIAAGILAEEFEHVREALTSSVSREPPRDSSTSVGYRLFSNLKLLRTRKEKEWRSGTFLRPPAPN
jgi:ribosomal protein L11 methyltransferase